MCRFCLLTGDDSPYVWDFGSEPCITRRYSDWLEPRPLPCRSPARHARHHPARVRPDEEIRQDIAQLIKDAGMADMPVGVDYAETAMFHALLEEGINVVDGQQIMLAAREIKNWDEIQLLTQAAAMVDGVYRMNYRRGAETGCARELLSPCPTRCSTRSGSDDVEAINAISGERCHPAHRQFHRPADRPRFGVL